MAIARARARKEAEDKKKADEHVDVEVLKAGDATNFPKKGDSIAVYVNCNSTLLIMLRNECLI